MLNADRAPYFATCPRCGVGGLERLKTHAFCVNCNYEEIYGSELCALPQWALASIKGPAKERKQRVIKETPRLDLFRKSLETKPDGSAA